MKTDLPWIRPMIGRRDDRPGSASVGLPRRPTRVTGPRGASGGIASPPMDRDLHPSGARPARGKRVLLEGLTGTYNRGGEGIIRGTYEILRRSLPAETTMTYAAFDPAADRPALGDLDVRVVPACRPLSVAERAVNKLTSTVGGGLAYKGDVGARLAAESDAVLSIGGDLYTLWPGERSATRFQMVDRTRRLMDACPRFILWGASIGPFDENPAAMAAFREVLGRMALILAREPVTVAYLAGLGITENVRWMGDPAFLLEPAAEDDPRVRAHRPAAGRRTLAVNLGPLAVDQTIEDRAAREAMPRRQARMLAELLDDDDDLDLLLVPHVEGPADRGSDDLMYLEEVRRHLTGRHAARVRALPRGLRAGQIKRLLSYCEAAIAARMHCAIAALSMGVPTLLLSYSPKALGMARYVYGDDRWVLPITADHERIVATTRSLFSLADDLRGVLDRRRPEFREDALRGGRWLREALAA